MRIWNQTDMSRFRLNYAGFRACKHPRFWSRVLVLWKSLAHFNLREEGEKNKVFKLLKVKVWWCRMQVWVVYEVQVWRYPIWVLRGFSRMREREGGGDSRMPPPPPGETSLLGTPWALVRQTLLFCKCMASKLGKVDRGNYHWSSEYRSPTLMENPWKNSWFRKNSGKSL